MAMAVREYQREGASDRFIERDANGRVHGRGRHTADALLVVSVCCHGATSETKQPDV
jgi:hypothetical protein